MFEFSLLAIAPTLAPTAKTEGISRLVGCTIHRIDGRAQLQKAWDYFNILKELLYDDSKWSADATDPELRQALKNRAMVAKSKLMNMQSELEKCSVIKNWDNADAARSLKHEVRTLHWDTLSGSDGQRLNARKAPSRDAPQIQPSAPDNSGISHPVLPQDSSAPGVSAIGVAPLPLDEGVINSTVREFMSQASTIAGNRQLCVKFEIQSNPPMSFTFIPTGSVSSPDPFETDTELALASNSDDVIMRSWYTTRTEPEDSGYEAGSEGVAQESSTFEDMNTESEGASAA